MDAAIRDCRATVYRFPTERPEADGTFAWQSTTLLLVEVAAAGATGLGFSYTHAAAAKLVNETLAPLVERRNAFDIAAATDMLKQQLRNLGRPGLGMDALSAIDIALWDLKARLLGLPLVSLLGQRRTEVTAYASGGFTSYSLEQLEEQFADWTANGFDHMKMKVGREQGDDVLRVRTVAALSGDARLMVDANGAWSRKEALTYATKFADLGVVWFEEPVSSDDVSGLRFVRGHAPSQIAIAAGEYGYGLHDFRRLLEADAVDVLQADATRCGGISGLIEAATLAQAFETPFSAHCAPSIHLHPCCALPRVCHLEYFHDHRQIERLLFDGAVQPTAGRIQPDLGRPGLGLELKRTDAERFEI